MQERWREAYPLFRFTAAERAPLPTAWKDLQFKPGDWCDIRLAGELAATGIITRRQTAYDANSHAVELSGAGRSWIGATSSVGAGPGGDGKTPPSGSTKPADVAKAVEGLSDPANNTFVNMTLKQMADKVLAPYSIPVLEIGTVPTKIFEQFQAQPGELIFDMLDRASRITGNVSIGSDRFGNILLIGQHSFPVVQQLVEGENILKMQCIFSTEQMYNLLSTSGQGHVRDEKSAAETNSLFAHAQSVMSPAFRYRHVVAEEPPDNQLDAQARVNALQIQADGTMITVNVTVQGWRRDGTNLWRAGDDVWVYSPMAMLNLVMSIQTVTFSQDSQNGTLTVLELVLPWKLMSKPLGVGQSPADISIALDIQKSAEAAAAADPNSAMTAALAELKAKLEAAAKEGSK